MCLRNITDVSAIGCSPIRLPEHAVEASEVIGEHELIPHLVSSLSYLSKAFSILATASGV